jgi:hypothetical protein
MEEDDTVRIAASNRRKDAKQATPAQTATAQMQQRAGASVVASE